MNASVMDIKRFAVHDGDGIRTTIFLKGCPLRCVWCHNPEGLLFDSQTTYIEHKCIGCGECARVCQSGAHIFENGTHKFIRENCTSCGKCEQVCLGESMKTYGKKMSDAELLDIVLQDREFYENSGGGVTLSGGECLMQAEFCRQFLSLVKKEGIHTAVDTCGFVKKDAIDAVAEYTDIFLYDIKAIDKNVHIKCTGQPNEIILENIKYIDSLGKKTEVRIPYVPGYNDNQIEKIANFLLQIKNLTKVKILPYHNYAASKYDSLGIKNMLPKIIPSNNDMILAKQKMQKVLKDIPIQI